MNDRKHLKNFTRQTRWTQWALFALLLFPLNACRVNSSAVGEWPPVNAETRPWTRWWWHGSALTKEGITAELRAYQEAGIGGVEITPIYGVSGYEEKFVSYLSPQWMELLDFTLAEAKRLGLGIDMATGTGWPFGGPWVTTEDASKHVRHKVYSLTGGEKLSDTIRFVEAPFVRAVGNQVYEVHGRFSDTPAQATGTRKEPLLRLDPRTITIDELVEPIAANPDLQRLALDQVRFEKELLLQAVIGYETQGHTVDLTSMVDDAGILNWTAPPGEWEIYAVFQGWHGKMVERAGPGGEGYVIDHFSKGALQHYLERFDRAFNGHDVSGLRAFFNDSYEVDDARGNADWTPALLAEFRKRKGYALEDHLPALFGSADPEKNRRVLCDYRETISALLLENFTQPWRQWAKGKAALTRNQAHGSPSNILDLYAAVDIPEIEGVEPLRIRMASSAGNVAGKKLISSESATWLDEHFESSLGDIKVAVDRFLLNGVNHIFYHGTSYSPPGEPWPGWLFYAAVHLNSRNPQWKDFSALNEYIGRCQSFLQSSVADHDVLLYYPLYDRFSTPGDEMIEHFDGIGRQFEKTVFAEAAQYMLERGYTFDFISDRQLQASTWENESIKTEGNAFYKTIVIPQCEFIPLATLRSIIALAEKGATILMFKGTPGSWPGYADYDKSKTQFEHLIKKLGAAGQRVAETSLGRGRVLQGDSLEMLLVHASIARERMTDLGITFSRKRNASGERIYLVNNGSDTDFEGWIALTGETESIVLFDPMTGVSGKARQRIERDETGFFLQLGKKQTLLLRAFPTKVEVREFPYSRSSGDTVRIDGPWKLDFVAGGPVLAREVSMDSLRYWNLLDGNDYRAFSGTAVYRTTFPRPQDRATSWLLDLGQVRESAEVILNGKHLGVLLGPDYRITVDGALLHAENELQIVVSNLMANRIADLDRRNILWKKFYNINFPARKAENRKEGLFDAAHWMPRDSGLAGPVCLIPLKPL